MGQLPFLRPERIMVVSLGRFGVAFALACVSGLTGCTSQQGYTHSAKEFSDSDRRAIRTVEKSPLGNPALLRQVVDGELAAEDALFGSDLTKGKPLNPCEYFVEKVIERNGPKKTGGEYFYHYRVMCITTVGDDPYELQFDWEVQEGEYGVVAFRWAWSDRNGWPDT